MSYAQHQHGGGGGGSSEKIQVIVMPQDDWGGNTTAMTADLSDLNDDNCTEAGTRNSQFYGTRYDPEYDNTGNIYLNNNNNNMDNNNRWPPISSSHGCLSSKLYTKIRLYFGQILATCVVFVSFFTPIVFITLPKIVNLSALSSSDYSSTYSSGLPCGIECEGQLVSISFRLLILIIGTWAIFVRRVQATLPKINELRALLILLLTIVTVTFWVFYIANVLHFSAISVPFDYFSILQFSTNNIDVLLAVYVLSVVVVELRHLHVEYVVTIYRSPDGEQRTYSLGRMSVQRASVWLLEQYYRDFKVYNPWLEMARNKRAIQLKQAAEFQQQQQQNVSTKQRRGGQNNVTNEVEDFLDEYDAQSTMSGYRKNTSKPMSRNQSQIDNGDAQSVTASQFNRKSSRPQMGTSNNNHTGVPVKTNLSANDRLYQENEFEKRLKKRRAKLICVTEEAFTHVKRVHHQQQQTVNDYQPISEPTVMNPHETAQAIFSTISRDLRRYLRATRQQPYFTRESILADLARCISYDIAPRTFLEKYMGGECLAFNERALVTSYMQTTPINPAKAEPKFKTDQNWILICDSVLYQNIEDNLMLVLKQNEVSLMCTFKRLPRFTLIEDVLDPKRNKFLIKLNSETTV